MLAEATGGHRTCAYMGNRKVLRKLHGAGPKVVVIGVAAEVVNACSPTYGSSALSEQTSRYQRLSLEAHTSGPRPSSHSPASSTSLRLPHRSARRLGPPREARPGQGGSGPGPLAPLFLSHGQGSEVRGQVCRNGPLLMCSYAQPLKRGPQGSPPNSLTHPSCMQTHACRWPGSWAPSPPASSPSSCSPWATTL